MFKIGDTVSWTSQAGGHRKKKIGKVIAVIQPNELPQYVIPKIFLQTAPYKLMFDRPMSPRGKHSYLIAMKPGPKGGKAKVYWPTKKLKREEGE